MKTAWIIEYNGKGFCVRDTGFKISGQFFDRDWTTNFDEAIQFVRKQDAELMSKVLFKYGLKVNITEHVWKAYK